MGLKFVFSFNSLFGIKVHLENVSRHFGVQSWSLPHSQIRGEIVTYLVKILSDAPKMAPRSEIAMRNKGAPYKIVFH